MAGIERIDCHRIALAATRTNLALLLKRTGRADEARELLASAVGSLEAATGQ